MHAVNVVCSARTRLSKSLVTDPAKLEWRTASDLKIRYNTTIRIGVVSRAHPSGTLLILFSFQTVTGIDFEGKKVTIDVGKETFAYDKLILATGGVPRKLPIEGSTLENVFTFRGLDDAKKVDAGMTHSPICLTTR